MDAIAEDIELSKATLYLYFENKISLFFAIVIEGMQILKSTLMNAAKKGSTGLDRILSIFHAYFDYIETNSDYYRLNLSSRAPRFAKLLQNQEESEPMVKNADTYIQLTKDLFGIILKAVNKGVKDKTIRKDLDPVQTVMFLGTAIEDMAYISPEYKMLLDMRGIPTEQYLDHTINILLDGIASKKK
jgi:AcrR family transcriptional regulator